MIRHESGSVSSINFSFHRPQYRSSISALYALISFIHLTCRIVAVSFAAGQLYNQVILYNEISPEPKKKERQSITHSFIDATTGCFTYQGNLNAISNTGGSIGRRPHASIRRRLRILQYSHAIDNKAPRIFKFINPRAICAFSSSHPRLRASFSQRPTPSVQMSLHVERSIQSPSRAHACCCHLFSI